MRTFDLGVAGAVAGAILFSSVGSVLAQGLFEADPVGLQFERDVRSTYIVRLANDLPSQAVNNRASEVAARFGGRIKYTYTNAINGFAITMPSVAMARMTRAGGLDIISVTRDGIVTIDVKPDAPGGGKGKPPKDGDQPVDEEPPVTEETCDQELPWGVARVTGMASPNGCNLIDPAETQGYGGDAPAVCAIDTGVDFDHPDLNVDKSNFVNYSTDKSADDLHGHGSHVAGTIGAVANNIGVVGVAPGANIVSVKVLNRRGSGAYSDVIAGVDWVAEGTHCQIANMSLGGPVSKNLDDAVRCAASTGDAGEAGCPDGVVPGGVTFTIAAGNSGENANNHSPARTGGGNDNIHTIAAMDQGDLWIYFSNYGPDIDYIQPGVGITSTFKNGGYRTYNGTSMAAPHMAGLLLRDIVNEGSFATDGVVPDGHGGSYPIVVDSFKYPAN